ncbi:complement factor B [Denticeps clupeoides]|uniref:complement factor B n=1 Tax=Denticeps clupeoides TaxID=299321 RepID=UPI0010A2C2FF|nr:complement factor B-like [Denticeps clupeoides]
MVLHRVCFLCLTLVPLTVTGESSDFEDDYEEAEEWRNCSTSESISKGQVSYSMEGVAGSELTYECQDNYYPYPVRTRVCGSDGNWTPMRLASGRPTSRATCKEILCPAQIQLDHGELLPRKQWFKVGENQTFSCSVGFVLKGSTLRTCTQLGHWTGETPVCDDQAEDCSNPGIPPGGRRIGNRFRIGDKVQYQCEMGLDLLGSVERECLDSGEWSGTETRCQAQYAFDSPSSVAQAMSGSLSSLMDVSSPEYKKKARYSRILEMSKGIHNIFILLDTSGSIADHHIQEARKATANLIQKLDSYEVKLTFHVLSYASHVKEIIRFNDYGSHLSDIVIKKVMDFNYKSHGRGTGTNLYKGLENVYKAMGQLKARNRDDFNKTQNVILIATDGHSNTGRNPKAMMSKIRDFLGYSTAATDHTEENLLDVYVFGIGESVNKKELNGLASKKRSEKHVFVLKKYEDLGEVFNKMIDDTAVTMCGVAKEDQGRGFTKVESRPWHVNVKWNTLSCLGSIVSKKWTLTAAHCLMIPKQGSGNIRAKPEEVTIENAPLSVKAKSLFIHPQYNVLGLRSKNVNEFYDYDIALVETEDIPLSSKARPICLPCTESASRALKITNATCAQHEEALLNLKETRANFLTKDNIRSQTHIQAGDNRPDCINQVSKTFFSNTTASSEEVVTDRFLCTGGSKSHRDDIACKGDSGGSLFLRKGMRYFQVGVLSWGNTNVCDSIKYSRNNPPPDARDFYINIFSVVDWLKQYLDKDLAFLPSDN